MERGTLFQHRLKKKKDRKRAIFQHRLERNGDRKRDIISSSPRKRNRKKKKVHGNVFTITHKYEKNIYIQFIHTQIHTSIHSFIQTLFLVLLFFGEGVKQINGHN